jgi:cysteine-rich repeat protein
VLLDGFAQALRLSLQCDDGNPLGDDGCSSSCQIEEGYQCPNPGAPCYAAQCGDGIRVGRENCDGKCRTSSASCSFTTPFVKTAICWLVTVATNHATLSLAGFATEVSSCPADDGRHPLVGACCFHIVDDCAARVMSILRACSYVAGATVCGDGSRASGEACDDGNLQNDDGCNALCKVLPASFRRVVVYCPWLRIMRRGSVFFFVPGRGWFYV